VFFSPEFLTSLIKCKCNECGKGLAEPSVFGNGIVINENGIRLQCVHCRTGKSYFRSDWNSIGYANVDIFRFILKLNEFGKRENINWHNVVLALRLNYDYFNVSEINENRAFTVKRSKTLKDDVYQNDFMYTLTEYEEPKKDLFGNLLALNFCGECKGLFYSQHSYQNLDSLEKNQCCPSCKIPNKFQWNLRTDEQSELIKNKKTNRKKTLMATMAISNCLLSPTLEIPAEFPTWCVLAKLSAKPRNYS
jgi:hypothetical protein